MEKMKFLNWKKENQIVKCTIPQCAPVVKNPDDETKEQLIARQEKFLKLPEAVKDKLVSQQVSEKIQRIGKTFNLQILEMGVIARYVRNYYFGEVKLEDFPALFLKEIEIDLNKAQEISRMIIEGIINDKSFETAYQGKIKEVSISEALKQYRKIGDQMITNNRIKIRVFPDPVRPSIKNWIDDYYENLGAGDHGSIERGNFLFHGVNTKGLSTLERQKLGMVLKSLDENSPLKINTEKEEIIFDQTENSPSSGFKIEKKAENNDSPKTISNFGNMKFSSPQKMTSEKSKNPSYISPIGMGGANQNGNANPSQTNPKVKGNIVDLRNP
jgi:hypothetical protein